MESISCLGELLISQSDVDVTLVAAEFARHGVEAAYFVPTPTGLTKSIIDATYSVRRFLVTNKLHSFDMQEMGPEHRASIGVDLVHADRFDLRQMSLYRPLTKSGDPRLWISRLADYAQPGNLIALVESRPGRLTAINCSDPVIWGTRTDPASPLGSLLTLAGQSSVADELLAKLRDVCRLGYVRSLRSGPTGVGYTLETHLGIKANSSKAPDYQGIEIKSSRVADQGKARTRSTLFSKTPDWKVGPLRSGNAILERFGYIDAISGRKQLYCSLSNKPNTQGLFLRLNGSQTVVEAVCAPNDVAVVWGLEVLEEALAVKHRETFWVKAAKRIAIDGTEEFRFDTVVHTRRPLVANLGLLIGSGTVEMDFTLSKKPSGGTRDHGYLFKLWPKDLELLFPPPKSYDLTA